MSPSILPNTAIALLCPDVICEIIHLVPDSATLAALSQTCQAFNIAINSRMFRNIWKKLFRKEVEVGKGEKERRFLGEASSWKEMCRSGLDLRATLAKIPIPRVFEMPHTEIYGGQVDPPPPLNAIANQSQSVYLGIGYFDCRVMSWDSSGPTCIAVWGDFFGLRLVCLPSMEVRTVASDINHGKVMSVTEHPDGKGLFMATTEGHVIIVSDITPDAEGAEGVIPYRFNPGAHGGGECNHLEVTSNGKLMSASADGKVVLWPDAIEGMISNFQILIEPHPAGLIVCQTLFNDGFLISGDFKGKVNLWWKSSDPIDHGELTVDDDGEFAVLAPPNSVPPRYFHKGRYNSLSKGKKHQKAVSVTALEVLHAEEGTFVSGNSYGELRGWKLEKGETHLFGEDVEPKLTLKWKIPSAHTGTVDICWRVGELLVTTGKGGVVTVWNAGREGDKAPKELKSFALTGTSGSRGSGSFGVVEEAWSENRVVGFDLVGGYMVGLRQDGLIGIWKCASVEEGKGKKEGELAGSAKSGMQRIKRKRLEIE
eukprot:CAMPEP_0118650198 /NCGR_PEP_ID=MMETSP0785-20121206/10117_1 /TAXON_ID=91992 /ORGANISM="Bolidomonas pacifica, Strain CCMP 1866" /LENGTH=538 /DNA_ID=CAMNT_0006542553 /DNA_START=6 /DNA_END=1622 /DNA_ORIENTATION=+